LLGFFEFFGKSLHYILDLLGLVRQGEIEAAEDLGG